MQCISIWAVWDVWCLSRTEIVVVAVNEGLGASCCVANLQQQQLWMLLGSVESLV